MKVICVGDSGQLASVQAGGWLRAIGKRTGNFALTETMRQRDPGERRALGALHAGAPDGWLDWATSQGRIDVHSRARDAVERAVFDWDAGVRAHGPEQSVMIARDNARRRVLNDAARGLRRTRGELGTEVDYGSTPLAIGDRIICRSNDAGLDVDNGMRGTVTHVEAMKLMVQTDTGLLRELPAEYAAAHVEHAYCLTGHGMQGATVEQAVVVANPGHMTAGWSYSALSRARSTTRLHLVGEEAQAAADQRAQRRDEGPQQPRTAGSAEQVIAATRFVMGKRDDEDLAVDQIRGLPGPGRAADPALTGAVAGPAPIVQEAGADLLEAQMSPAQQQLVGVDRQRQQLRLQRQALPHRDLEALQAARAEHQALLVLREKQALAAAAVPPPGRLRDPHAAERSYATTVLEMTDERISATNRQISAIAARLGDGSRQRSHELDSIDERLRHLDIQHQERTGDVVRQQQEQPPEWLIERIGPRPPDGTERRRWDAAVRNSTLAQLHDTADADLRRPLSGQPPQDKARVQAWRRAIESQRAVVGDGRGGFGR